MNRFLSSAAAKKFLKLLLAVVVILPPWVGVFFLARTPPGALVTHVDPDWSYLLNGLVLSTGGTPGHVDHPGTTVHWLVALACRIWKAVSGQPGGLVDAVLLAPERVLYFSGEIIGLLNVLGFFLLSVVTARRLGWRQALMANALWLFSSEILIQFRRVDPDGLIIFFTTMLLCLLASFVLRREAGKGNVFASALVFSLGVASKITFLQTAVLAMLWPSRAQRWAGALVSILIFFLVTIPIHARIGSSFEMWFGALTHVKSYGTGAWGLFNARMAWENLSAIARVDASPFLTGLVFLMAGLPLAAGKGRPQRLYRAGGVLFLLGIGMIAKHGGADQVPGLRYILPITIILPWMLAALVFHEGDGALDGRWRSRAVFVSVLLLILYEASVSYGRWSQRRLAEDFGEEYSEAVRGIRKARPDCAYLSSYMAAVRESGLFYGGGYVRGQLDAALMRLYPDTFLLGPGGNVRAFSGEEQSQRTWGLWGRAKKCIIYSEGRFENRDAALLFPGKSRKLKLEKHRIFLYE